MTTNGQQYIHIRRNGKRLTNVICILLVLIVFVSGCSAGRGDWKYELIEGYAINRINAHGVVLVHYDTLSDSGAYVISNFYVTDYCLNQRFIGIQGIPTVDMWATDAELVVETRTFYLLDASKDILYGPYVTASDFAAQCVTVSSGNMGEWCSVNDIAQR